MAALPNLSGLSLGGGGKEEEEALDTGLVVQYASGGPEERNHRTGFSQMLDEYPFRVPSYTRILDARPHYGFRNQLRQFNKGNLLELGLAAEALYHHFSQLQWPTMVMQNPVPQPGPLSTDDDFVRRWLQISPTFRNAPTPVLSATTDLRVMDYPRNQPPQGTQLISVRVGYKGSFQGVLRSANETMLVSTKEEQQLAPRGNRYSMATYNELWFINTKQAQIDMWPQMKQDLYTAIDLNKMAPTDPQILDYLKRCLRDLVANAKQKKPLYLYGGNAIQDVLQSQYVDLVPDDPNGVPRARNRTFFFARRGKNDAFKALGEVVSLEVEHTEPTAERERAQARADAADQNYTAVRSPATLRAKQQADAYLARVLRQLQSNDVTAPWFTLELQQLDYDQMCKHTDWQALNTQVPPNVGYQDPLDKIFAHLAPPEDINTNPMFGDASKTVPWPDVEEGEEWGPLDAYRGMSLYETIRAIEAARAAPGYSGPP